MSVRHLERWPSADWGEIWFPVHIGSHPPGSVRKWVRAQISATALVTLISDITPQCNSKLWVRSNRGRKRIGGFVSARPWVETGARWIALLLAGYQVWPHLLSRSLSGTRSWMTPCRSSGRLASSPYLRLTKAWLKEYSTYIHAHITNFTFNFSVATS